MKIRDLINKMTGDTEVIIYNSYTGCSMPPWGGCEGGADPEYDCRDCTAYVPNTTEWTKYHGKASECPIKLADEKVQEINNAAHMVEVGGKRRKKEVRYVIAIRI